MPPICRHAAGDPNCSSHPDHVRREAYSDLQRDREAHQRKVSQLQAQIDALTPDAARYEILQVERVGPHLVVMAQYPNCARCSYEGKKVMVFLDVSETEALRWRKIDPHFRDPQSKKVTEAPSPAARFPATSEGWGDAICYARGKSTSPRVP